MTTKAPLVGIIMGSQSDWPTTRRSWRHRSSRSGMRTSRSVSRSCARARPRRSRTRPRMRPEVIARSKPLPPGSTIGILGGGQLGRMLAIAAAKLGFRTNVYSDEADCPAFDVATVRTAGAFTDLTTLTPFARTVDVVTFEFENVPVEAARHISGLVPVRPGPVALEVAQGRLGEKGV